MDIQLFGYIVKGKREDGFTFIFWLPALSSNQSHRQSIKCAIIMGCAMTIALKIFVGIPAKGILLIESGMELNCAGSAMDAQNLPLNRY